MILLVLIMLVLIIIGMPVAPSNNKSTLSLVRCVFSA